MCAAVASLLPYVARILDPVTNETSLNRIAVALLAVAPLAGCDGLLTKPSLYNDVPVLVTRTTGAPIADVELELYTGQRPMGYGTTSTDGRFTFTRVPQGLYGVAATAPPGYARLEDIVAGPPSYFVDNLRVANDTLSLVHFSFLKKGPGTVVVTVTQRDGTPLVGVPLEVIQPTQTDARATTNSAGRAVFNDIPFGVHAVVVTRPPFFKDFQAPNDSAFAVRNDLIVEDGSRDSVAFSLPRCAGTVRATVVDQFGAPVPAATLTLYTSSQDLFVRASGADGRVTFPETTCATQFGLRVAPAPGYSAIVGRGFSFTDGITLTGGQTLDVTLRLRRGP